MYENYTLGETALDLAMKNNKAYSVFYLIKCGAVLQAKQGNLDILFICSIGLMFEPKY